MALLILNYTITRFLLLALLILIYEDQHIHVHVLCCVPMPLMVTLNFLGNEHFQWQYHNYYSSNRQEKWLIITFSDDLGVIKINMTVNLNKCMPEAKLFPYRK